MLSSFKGWSPNEVATLTFLRRGHEVLLIRKLRGHGAGKINAPGGKVDRGETPLDAARRETWEEICVRTLDLACRAELRFLDADGSSMRGFVFVTDRFSGAPRSTVEADPFWCATRDIPYDEMWADDRIWLPRVLTGECLVGEFLMQGDALLDHYVTAVDCAGLAVEAARRVE